MLVISERETFLKMIYIFNSALLKRSSIEPKVAADLKRGTLLNSVSVVFFFPLYYMHYMLTNLKRNTFHRFNANDVLPIFTCFRCNELKEAEVFHMHYFFNAALDHFQPT